MASSDRVVHLVDGHVYIFRAWFVMPDMRAPDGRPTQAAYGFTNMLLKHWREEEPTHLAVCFDYEMTSFRNDLEPGYKAQRGEPDEELELQFELCREAARALGLPVFEAKDYEADDVIATIAKRMVAKGASVVVHTIDKDLGQLVREDGRVVLADLGRPGTTDAAAVRAKFGVEPAQIPDYLALVGDTVDNLSGVPGIGAKTAAAVLAAFGSVERIPEDPARWAGVAVRGAARAAERIAAHRERALRTKQLATVRDDVPGIAPGLRELALRGADRSRVEPLFEGLGWGRIARRIPRWA